MATLQGFFAQLEMVLVQLKLVRNHLKATGADEAIFKIISDCESIWPNHSIVSIFFYFLKEYSFVYGLNLLEGQPTRT